MQIHKTVAMYSLGVLVFSGLCVFAWSWARDQSFALFIMVNFVGIIGVIGCLKEVYNAGRQSVLDGGAASLPDKRTHVNRKVERTSHSVKASPPFLWKWRQNKPGKKALYLVPKRSNTVKTADADSHSNRT